MEDVERVEDSDPERWDIGASDSDDERKGGAQLGSSGDNNLNQEQPKKELEIIVLSSSCSEVDHQELVPARKPNPTTNSTSPHASTSTSHYFRPPPPTQSDSFLKRRRPPWEQADPSLSPFPLPAPLPSSVADPTTDCPPPKVPRQKAEGRTQSQLVSAAKLLKTHPVSPPTPWESEGSSEVEMGKQRATDKGNVKGKGKGKGKTVGGGKRGVRKVSSASLDTAALEEIEIEVDELDSDQEEAAENVDKELNATNRMRAIYDLPALKSKHAKEAGRNLGKGKLKAKGSWKDEEEEEGEGDSEVGLSASERLRKGLDKFKYSNNTAPTLVLDSDDNDDNDDDDSKPSASSSTSILPTKPRRKATTKSRLAPEPLTPIDLPPNDRLRALESCPICKSAFAKSKSIPSISTHLRNCARAQDYTAETVEVLIEKQILSLASEYELARRESHSARSLFDKAIGKGEGSNPLRAVTVVGVAMEGDELGWDRANALDIQEELEAEKKRPQESNLLKVARSIKAARREKEALEEEEKVKRKREKIVKDEMEVDEEEPSQAVAPRPTGMLRGDSLDSRKAVADRASNLLSDLGGTGLTQTTTVHPPAGQILAPLVLGKAPSSPSVVPPPAEDADIIIDEDQELALPSTQPFQPSKLARKFHEQAEGVALELPHRREASIGLESATRGLKSLWATAAGTDDEAVNRVVSSPPSSPSPDLVSSFRDLTIRTEKGRLNLDGSSIPGTTNKTTRNLEEDLESVNDSMRTLGLGNEDEEGGWDDAVLVWEGVESGEESSREHGGNEKKEKQKEKKKKKKRKEYDIIVISSSSEDEDLPTKQKTPTLFRKPRITSKAVTTSPIPHLSKTFNPSKATKSTTSTSTRRPKSTPRLPTLPSPSSAYSSSDDLPPLPPIPAQAQARPVISGPSMPDYASFDLAALQKEVMKFGFRNSKVKAVLVRQLTEVWTAMNPQPPSCPAISESPKKIVRKRAKKVEGAEKEELESVESRLRKLILGDEKMYLKVLRYEPIPLDDVVNLAVEGGVKCAKPVIVKFLDEMSITFYSQDPTKGSRKRR